MPKETPQRTSTRWEGTHTYARSGERRPRTAAEVREEALRRIQEDRKKRNELADRRRSLPATTAQHTPRTKSNQHTPDVVREKEEESDDPVIVEEKKMPGSNKKKRHASTAKPAEEPPQEDNAGTEDVAPGLKAFLLSMKEDINRSTNEAVGRIDKRIDDHAQSISELKQAVVDIDKKLEDRTKISMAAVESKLDERIANTVRKEIAKTSKVVKLGNAETPGPGPASSRRQEAYNFCRRSLKMWPLEGDLQDAVRSFLSTRLQLSQGAIDSLGNIEISMSHGRGARDKKEAIVTFLSKEERDYVKAAGPKLAGQSEAGMAIHVPGHLLDNLAALNGVGYNIKMKHEGVKRTVRFDDIQQDIYMDIFVGGNWKKITPTKAKTVAKQVANVNSRSDLTLEDLSQLVQGEQEEKESPMVVPDDQDQ